MPQSSFPQLQSPDKHNIGIANNSFSYIHELLDYTLLSNINLIESNSLYEHTNPFSTIWKCTASSQGPSNDTTPSRGFIKFLFLSGEHLKSAKTIKKKRI